MIITIGRKPFTTSVAENIEKCSCGGIDIDGTRIESDNLNEGRFPSNFIVLSAMTKALDIQGGYRKTGKMSSIARGTGNNNRCYGKQYVRPVFAEASEGYVSRYFKIIEGGEKDDGI